MTATIMERESSPGSALSQSPEGQALLPPTTPPPQSSPPTHHSRAKITIILFFILFCLNLSGQVVIPALSRILENIYCLPWYLEHNPSAITPGQPIDEALCKLPVIQQQVSTLRGWMEWWNALPGLFLAVPFGILADRIGRRLVFRLSISVIFLRSLWIVFVCATGIPMKAIYLSSVLNIFCGGEMVAEMMFFVILTDITSRQELPTIFFQLNAVIQLTKVIGPAICGALMRFSPWYPVLTALALQLAGAILSFLIPETLKKVDDDDDDDDRDTPNQPFKARLAAARCSFIRSLTDLASIWSDRRLLFLAALYPFRMMTNALDELLQRYVSYRYHWSLANATFLYSLQASVATAILFLLLPAIAAWIDSHLRFSAIRKNVVIAKFSMMLLAAGYLLEGFAPTIAVLIVGLMVQTLGSGLPPSLRALAGALVEQEDNGRVFSGLALSETLSVMAAYPLSSALFNKGIEMGGGVWLGLPFYATGLAIVVLTVGMCLVRFERDVASSLAF